MNRILLAIILFLAAAIAPAQTIKLVHPYDTNAFSAKFPTDDKILHRSSTTTLSDGTIGYIEDYLQNGESVVSFVCYTEFPKSFIFGTSIADEMLNGMEEEAGTMGIENVVLGSRSDTGFGPVFAREISATGVTKNGIPVVLFARCAGVAKRAWATMIVFTKASGYGKKDADEFFDNIDIKTR